MSSSYCSYCGLKFQGGGFVSNADGHYCCYGCYLAERIVASKGESGMAAWLVIRLGVGAFLAMNVMMISIILYTQSVNSLGSAAVNGMKWAMLLLSAPAMVILTAPFIVGSIKDLNKRRISTDALISTGSLAAFGVSAVNAVRGSGQVYFDTATMLPLLITLGRLIEASAKTRTSQAIRGAFDLPPQVAHVIRGGRELDVPAQEIIKDEILVIKPGERAPCDSEILTGRCMIEESMFTGEAMPRSCAPGDKIFGGSVNCDGLITVRALNSAAESRLAQIEEVVKRAQQEQAPIERLTERVASFFVPAVWLIAACTFIYWALAQEKFETAAMSAMAVLVVACPCALGLATPMAICIAIGKAAKSGLLIRSGETLEKLPRVKNIFFDKTGTLTENHVKVSDVVSDIPDESLAWAASAAQCSEHIASKAIVEKAKSEGILLGAASNFQTHPGLGISATVTLSNETWRITLGSLDLLKLDHDIDSRLMQITEPLTTIYVGWDKEIKAALLLEDALRAEAKETIQAISRMEIKTAVISGDRELPSTRIARSLGINDIFSSCNPIEKSDVIRKAKESRSELVAMVGDGVNDAPALAEADVSIATGGGTDLARNSSDVILMGDDLSRIPWLIELSRKTCSVIRQNLLWAFGYNLIAISLACLGYIHPLIAASAMVISSITVIANSMKLMASK